MQTPGRCGAILDGGKVAVSQSSVFVTTFVAAAVAVVADGVVRVSCSSQNFPAATSCQPRYPARG